MKHPIKVSEFLSVCVHLVEQAGELIKKVRIKGNYKTQKKNEWDVFTIADVKVQKTIHKNLQALYPYLNLVGEEDSLSQQYKDIHRFMQPDQLNKKLVKDTILRDQFKQRKEELKRYRDQEMCFALVDEEESLFFNQEDAVVWIDPLDGSQGFARGETDPVTSIIGVSINGLPRFGVIHKPYYHNDYERALSRTFFGSVECGSYFIDKKDYMDKEYLYKGETRPFQYLHNFKNADIFEKHLYEVKTACTMNRFGQMQEALDHLQPSVNIRIGGAGNKGIFMLEDYADYMVHVVQGIKFWDMCAVDALMRGRLGITSNKDKKPIIYDHKLDDYTIKNGIIMARSQNIYDLCYQRLSPYFKNLIVAKGKL